MRLGGPNKVWGPSIDLRTPENFLFEALTTGGYNFLVCQGKYMPNASKGNAEK